MTFSTHLLEEHPDRLRILKLLYLVYSQVWITDANVLTGLKIHSLLQELLAQNDSIENLRQQLLENAALLSKSEIYLRVAETIIDAIQPQILRREKPVKPNQLQASQTASPSQSVADPFDVRFSIMQVLNPLKAKAILMALCYAPTPAEASEAEVSTSSNHRALTFHQLQTLSLDELLRKLLRMYPTIAALDRAIAQLSELPPEIDPQETVQLSQTLKEALRPYLTAKDVDSGKRTAPEHQSDISNDALCTILAAGPVDNNAIRSMLLTKTGG